MFANTQMGGMDFAFPDVLLTPMPAPVPIPYPNTATGTMGVASVRNVFFGGMPAHTMATRVPLTDGDNAGVAGVASGTAMGASRSVTGANTVLLAGMPATRLTSSTTQNNNNASGARITPSQTKVLLLAP
jgi:uncharacterized Zn-binding protein involved in type VI secretion